MKAALDRFLDDAHIGKVRYGDQEMTGYNALQILFTKSKDYEWENEIRSVVCSYDPVGGQARNYRDSNYPHREPQDDLNPIHPWVHVCKRRRIRLGDLLLGVAVSPWAGKETFEEVQTWANVRDHRWPVAYDLKSTFTPTFEELKAQLG